MSLFQLVITIALLLVGAGTSAAQSNSEVDAVKAVNAAYYIALSARNIDAMEKVWLRSPTDVNVAPPVRPAAHVGWTAIKKTYQTFWATLDELNVTMDNPTINIEGNVAWVYGTEEAKRRTKDGQASSGPNFGTSIFVKRGNNWLMIFHQAAIMPQPPK